MKAADKFTSKVSTKQCVGINREIMDTRNEEGELGRPLINQRRRHVVMEGFMKYLVAQEIFERTALRGVQTILAIFLVENLHFNEVVATELVHFFLIGSFISPIIGALVSDGYTGNYTACYIFSFCELSGHILLTTAAIPVTSWQRSPVNHVLVPFALVMVVIGSGALKPCQVTFGGDQMNHNFHKNSGPGPNSTGGHKTKRGSHEFFSAYYMSMTLGSLFSAVVAPILRVRGKGNYFYAFLMPACSMALCILSLWLGRNHYYYRPLAKLVRPSSTQPGTVGTGHEIPEEKAKLLGAEQEKGAYWQDFKDTLYVLFVLSPAVFFSAMFFQTSSTWVFQARSMDGHIPWLGGFTIQPDQMTALNPILVVLIIPVMDTVVYPLVEKYIAVVPNLKRMVLAIAMGSTAFVASGVLQVVIDSDLREKEEKGWYNIRQADISILWLVPQYFLMSLAETVMFIPAIDWSYTEAPESTKTVLQAGVHVYSAIGNLITITVVAIIGTGGSKVTESFVFAAMGALASGILSVLGYTYVTREMRTARRRGIQSE